MLHHADNIFISEEQFVEVRGYSASIEDLALSALPVQFRFVQLEHRGGFCDCWAAANLTVTLPNGQATELLYVSCLVIIYNNIIRIVFQQGMWRKHLRSLSGTFGAADIKSDIRDIR